MTIVGIPSDDDRFRRIYTFIHSFMDDYEKEFFTHRSAIPQKDSTLQNLIEEWEERFDFIIIPLTFKHFFPIFESC